MMRLAGPAPVNQVAAEFERRLGELVRGGRYGRCGVTVTVLRGVVVDHCVWEETTTRYR